MSQRSQIGLELSGMSLASPSVPGATRVQRLSVVPKKVTRLLLWITSFLTSIHVLTQLAILAFSDFTGRDWLVIMFGLGGEANLPATFSGGLLLFSAMLLGTIALERRRSSAPFAQHWTLLAWIFLYLGLDELASIHDHITVPLRRLLDSDGFFYYVWVIPYIAGVTALLLGSIRFLAHLAGSTRHLFFVAGTLYIGGALGMELLEGFYVSQMGSETFLDTVLVTVEELMEMLGAVVFIHALLCYIRASLRNFTLQLSVGPDADR